MHLQRVLWKLSQSPIPSINSPVYLIERRRAKAHIGNLKDPNILIERTPQQLKYSNRTSNKHSVHRKLSIPLPF